MRQAYDYWQDQPDKYPQPFFDFSIVLSVSAEKPRCRGVRGGESGKKSRSRARHACACSTRLTLPFPLAANDTSLWPCPLYCHRRLSRRGWGYIYRFSRVTMCRLVGGSPVVETSAVLPGPCADTTFFRAPAVSRLRPGRPLRDVSDAMIPTLVPCD